MAKTKKSSKGYFGLSHLVSIILAVIPVTNIIFGIVIRIQKKNALGAVLNFILAPLFYIVDLVTIIASNKLTFLV